MQPRPCRRRRPEWRPPQKTRAAGRDPSRGCWRCIPSARSISSLDRMLRILARLDHPERRMPPVIHVAGTNGKGSTVAFLRAILEAAGQRVHVYTSPHLVRINERYPPRGPSWISDARARSPRSSECERANAGAPITVFEITTAAAFLLFSRSIPPTSCCWKSASADARCDQRGRQAARHRHHAGGDGPHGVFSATRCARSQRRRPASSSAACRWSRRCSSRKPKRSSSSAAKELRAPRAYRRPALAGRASSAAGWCSRTSAGCSICRRRACSGVISSTMRPWRSRRCAQSTA